VQPAHHICTRQLSIDTALSAAHLPCRALRKPPRSAGRQCDRRPLRLSTITLWQDAKTTSGRHLERHHRGECHAPVTCAA
jgi:hypothetical protein